MCIRYLMKIAGHKKSNDIHLKSGGIIFLVMCITERNFYVHMGNFIISLTLNPGQNSLCMRTGYLLFMQGSQLVLYVLERTEIYLFSLKNTLLGQMFFNFERLYFLIDFGGYPWSFKSIIACQPSIVRCFHIVILL